MCRHSTIRGPSDDRRTKQAEDVVGGDRAQRIGDREHQPRCERDVGRPCEVEAGRRPNGMREKRVDAGSQSVGPPGQEPDGLRRVGAVSHVEGRQTAAKRAAEKEYREPEVDDESGAPAAPSRPVRRRRARRRAQRHLGRVHRDAPSDAVEDPLAARLCCGAREAFSAEAHYERVPEGRLLFRAPMRPGHAAQSR